MVFRVGVGKKIGGFNFFLGKTISSSSKKRVANSPRVQQPSVKDTKDKEFKDFLYKCERDTNYFIMDFFELNGYDPKRLQREEIDLDDLFAGDEAYETFSELVLSTKETIERVVYLDDTGIQAKRDIADKIFELKGFINRFKRREHVNPKYAFLKEPEPIQQEIPPPIKKNNLINSINASIFDAINRKEGQTYSLLGILILSLFWIGIIIFPFLFAWITLDKRYGFSKVSKFIAFGWLALLVYVLFFGEQPPSS